MELMGRWTGTALCSSPAPVDVAAGWVLATAAHWLGRQAWDRDWCSLSGKKTQLLPEMAVRISLCASF